MRETAHFFEMFDFELEQVEETGCLCMMPDLEVGGFAVCSMDLSSLRINRAQALYLLVEYLKSFSISYLLRQLPTSDLYGHPSLAKRTLALL